MKPKQLADRIGNIDENLISQTETAPNFGLVRRNTFFRRFASAAAVLVLMGGSFAVGAVAMPRQPEVIIEQEIVIVEETVYVEREQEIIVVGDSGISLILPDSWAGEYVYLYNDFGGVNVHHRASFEDEYWGVNSGGLLFRVHRVDGLLPLDYQLPWGGYVIASVNTDAGMVTYIFSIVSDVQWTPQYMDEYLAMFDDVINGNIQVLLTDWMRELATHAGNWEEGTAHVSRTNPYTFERLETFVMSAEQSRLIDEIINRQDFIHEWGGWRNDILIEIGGEVFYFNSTTGQLENANGNPRYSAVMSAEDIQIIMRFIE